MFELRTLNHQFGYSDEMPSSSYMLPSAYFLRIASRTGFTSATVELISPDEKYLRSGATSSLTGLPFLQTRVRELDQRQPWHSAVKFSLK